MDINITYFESTGAENTVRTLELAKKRALELNLKMIVLASTHGFTALEAGLVNENEQIIAIGGTGEGCDTAIVIKPAYARKVKDTQIYEIICKPRIG